MKEITRKLFYRADILSESRLLMKTNDENLYTIQYPHKSSFISNSGNIIMFFYDFIFSEIFIRKINVGNGIIIVIVDI